MMMMMMMIEKLIRSFLINQTAKKKFDEKS